MLTGRRWCPIPRCPSRRCSSIGRRLVARRFPSHRSWARESRLASLRLVLPVPIALDAMGLERASATPKITRASSLVWAVCALVIFGAKSANTFATRPTPTQAPIRPPRRAGDQRRAAGVLRFGVCLSASETGVHARAPFYHATRGRARGSYVRLSRRLTAPGSSRIKPRRATGFAVSLSLPASPAIQKRNATAPPLPIIKTSWLEPSITGRLTPRRRQTLRKQACFCMILLSRKRVNSRRFRLVVLSSFRFTRRLNVADFRFISSALPQKQRNHSTAEAVKHHRNSTTPAFLKKVFRTSSEQNPEPTTRRAPPWCRV